MFQRFFPNEYYDSTYHIDFQAFYDKGYRAVLFDVDNTLVEHDAPANARAKALIQKLKDMGYGVCFVSNNDEERVKSFNEQVGATYVYNQVSFTANASGPMCFMLSFTADHAGDYYVNCRGNYVTVLFENTVNF